VIELICTKSCGTCRKAAALLDENSIEYRYRDYKQEPLNQKELKQVLVLLGVKARDLLRKRDKAYKQHGLKGDEPDSKLLPLMAKHPTLLERPIGIKGKRAVVGRPVENLLQLK
jgi:arsenate reductase